MTLPKKPTPINRRALLASLPAVPVMALPAIASDDDQTHMRDLIVMAAESGVSIDLLLACTLDLTRDQRRAVLDRIAAFARKNAIIVQWRGNCTRSALGSAFEDMARIMERLEQETGQTGWSIHGGKVDGEAFSFDANIIDRDSYRFHLHLVYRNGTLRDDTARIQAGAA